MLRLTALARSDRIPLEADRLSPDRLAGLTLPEIERIEVWHGNRSLPLAEFFRVAGDVADGRLELEGDCATVKGIGARMTRGAIVVAGDAGMHLGAEMRGGSIRVDGSVADWAGAELAGGRIHIRGAAGNGVGAAYRGAKVGMRGGEILVEGTAGSEIGSRMRRGLIAIGGRSGDFPGFGMLAGTILLLGPAGARPGAGMRRGTIALMHPTDSRAKLLPSFRFACVAQSPTLGLYLSRLAKLGFAPLVATDAERAPGLLEHYRGDFLELGKGEVLVAAR